METTVLDPEQLEEYERCGFLVLPAAFSPSEIEEMRTESDRMVQWLVNASIALRERNPRLDLRRRDGEVVVRKIQPIVDHSQVFARYASDERLEGPLREILGCEPLLLEEKLNCKQVLACDVPLECPSEGDAFFPHTDWAYFREQGYPKQTLSSAISIDETRPDNGPIRVLPGSHLRDWPEREGYPPILTPGAVDEKHLVDVLAPPGSVVIFHSALVHSSSENRSGQPRRILIFSHYPSTHPGDPDRRNRPHRERAAAHEDRYKELLERDPNVPRLQVT